MNTVIIFSLVSFPFSFSWHMFNLKLISLLYQQFVLVVSAQCAVIEINKGPRDPTTEATTNATTTPKQTETTCPPPVTCPPIVTCPPPVTCPPTGESGSTIPDQATPPSNTACTCHTNTPCSCHSGCNQNVLEHLIQELDSDSKNKYSVNLKIKSKSSKSLKSNTHSKQKHPKNNCEPEESQDC